MEFYKKAFSAQEPTPGGQVLQPHIRCSSVLAEAGEEVRLIAASARVCNARFRRSPAGIEGSAGLVEVDDQRCVIRWDRFSFPRLAIDLGPNYAVL